MAGSFPTKHTPPNNSNENIERFHYMSVVFRCCIAVTQKIMLASENPWHTHHCQEMSDMNSEIILLKNPLIHYYLVWAG